MDQIEALGVEANEAIADAAKGSGDQLVRGVESAIARTSPDKFMSDAIKALEARRDAIEQLKTSLANLVRSLPEGQSAPIVIVVDELDRCRPNYAVSLLEEIKHLFDVPGLVFVFGMHGDQLAHAVTGLYGADFDGKAYLKRFFQRRYRLRSLSLDRLVEVLLADVGIDDAQFEFMDVAPPGFAGEQVPLKRLLSRYMADHGLSVRDVFQVIGVLETCVAISKGKKLFGPYLLPLIMSHVRGAASGELVAPVSEAPEWNYVVYPHSGPPREETPFSVVATSFHNIFQLPEREFAKRAANDDSVWMNIARRARINSGTNTLIDPARYPELIEAVANFS